MKAITLASLVAFLFAFPTSAKNPPGSNVDPAKAEAGATMALAGIAISRPSLADDPALANVKDAVGGIYDREEAAMKDALAKLKAAGGDKAKVAEGIAAIDAADDEATKYFQANPTVKHEIARHTGIVRAEIGQIAKSPDAYCAALAKAGLAGPSLAQAKALVKDASQKAGGQIDGDSAAALRSARAEVRKLLSAAEDQALDAHLAGK